LWIGTAGGLDRLREPKAVRLSSLEGLSSDLVTAVCPSADGSVCVGTAGGGLNRVMGSRVEHYLLNSGLPSTTVLSLLEDPEGTLWVGTSRGLVRRVRSVFLPVRLADGTALDWMFSITGDPASGYWFVDANLGLFTLRKGALIPVSFEGLPETRRISQVHCDRRGALWIGYHDGGLARVAEGVASKSPDFPFPSSTVQAIFDDDGGSLWVGTKAGLAVSGTTPGNRGQPAKLYLEAFAVSSKTPCTSCGC
jgi:ligand-binding sensor domain-containing protein